MYAHVGYTGLQQNNKKSDILSPSPNLHKQPGKDILATLELIQNKFPDPSCTHLTPRHQQQLTKSRRKTAKSLSKLDCFGNKMVTEGDISFYHVLPEGDGKWWSTQSYSTRQCQVKPI